MDAREVAANRMTKALEMAHGLLVEGHEGEAVHTYLTAARSITLTYPNSGTINLAELIETESNAVDEIAMCEFTAATIRQLFGEDEWIVVIHD